MSSEPHRDELLNALTTEHFTLQGARAQTATESASRASLFIFSVSSSLVALGFLGQGPTRNSTFYVFGLTVLPTLYVLGVVTFVRLVECGAEDYRYGVAINRIRHYYKELAGNRANLFLLSGHDDGPGVFGNAGVPVDGRTQFFTFATVVALIDSVIGGSIVAMTARVLHAPLGTAASTGGAVGLLSLTVLLRYAGRLLTRRTEGTSALFPSPEEESALDSPAPRSWAEIDRSPPGPLERPRSSRVDE